MLQEFLYFESIRNRRGLARRGCARAPQQAPPPDLAQQIASMRPTLDQLRHVTNTPVRTSARTLVRACTHTRSYTRARTCTRGHTHTRTYTRARPRKHVRTVSEIPQADRGDVVS